MKLRQFVSVLLVWGCVCPGLAVACRYNVRDIGFVDLDPESYHFYAYIGADTAVNDVSLLTDLATAAFKDSNIRFELIDPKRDAHHPALKYKVGAPFEWLPAGVLVSPDGQALPVPLLISGQPARQTMQAALHRLVSSPKREELLRNVSQAFGVVLFLEGTQAAENLRVRTAIAGAIEQIKSQLETLPKRISRPPVMMVIDAASFAREQVLLWSLGLDTNQTQQARAAVIYGRARWMGPLMKGEEITERNLTGILSIIGADCECGLDLAWTQGTRLPVRWDAQRQTDVARTLGFDPENPLVKMEASRIVGRRGSLTGSAEGNTSPLLDQPTNVPALADSRAVPSNLVATTSQQRDNQRSDGMVVPETTSPQKRLVLFLIGMATVVGGVGFWIFWRASGKG